MNNFFDRLGKKANEAYQATKEKTVNLTEEIKIKTKINEKNDKIEEIYAEIGKLYFEKHRDDEEFECKYSSYSAEVDRLLFKSIF